MDLWSAGKLRALLDGSEQGRRVARSFFSNVDSDVERLSRAQEAQGILDNADDVHDRLAPVGEFLATRDAFFLYPASTFEPGAAEQGVPEGTMLSMYEWHDESVTRVDAVPRDEDAASRYGPRGRITFPSGGEREATAEKIAFAIHNHVPFTAPEGTTLTFDRLPPFLASEVGEPIEGRIDLIPTRPRRPDLKVRLIAREDAQTASLDVTLRQAVRVPPEWDEVWEGAYGSFRMQMLLRTREPGTLTVNYGWNWDRTASISAQAKLLRFIDLVERGAALSLAERRSSKEEMVLGAVKAMAESDTTPLARFVENLLVIERWTRCELSPVPDDVSDEEVHTVAQVAALIRGRGDSVRLDSARLDVDAEGLARLKQGGRLAIIHEIRPQIFGAEVDVGRLWFTTTQYAVAYLGPASAGRTPIRISTPGEVSRRLEPPKPARRPGKGRAKVSKRKSSSRKGRRRSSRSRP